MTDAEILTERLVKVLHEWAEAQDNRSLILDVAQAVMAALEQVPFPGRPWSRISTPGTAKNCWGTPRRRSRSLVMPVYRLLSAHSSI
jgi:hypothetical protein